MSKVKFPISDKELTTFHSLLGTLDFEYFECALNVEDICEEDIEKIAVIKHCLEQINDVIASRIDWYEAHGLELPTGDALDFILEKYHD